MSEALLEALNTVFAIDPVFKPYFDDRQQKELQLALVYKHSFNHGTTGHNAYVVMAKLYEVALSAEGRLDTLADDYRRQTGELQMAKSLHAEADAFAGVMRDRVKELETELLELRKK